MEFMHGALERDKREGVSQRNEIMEDLLVNLYTRHVSNFSISSFFCRLFTLRNPGFHQVLFSLLLKNANNKFTVKRRFKVGDLNSKMNCYAFPSCGYVQHLAVSRQRVTASWVPANYTKLMVLAQKCNDKTGKEI